MPVCLPSEILERIIKMRRQTKKRKRLAPLATVNRKWQTVVEDMLWKQLNVSVKDFEDFQRFCIGDQRRRSLRHLRLSFTGFFDSDWLCEDDEENFKAAIEAAMGSKNSSRQLQLCQIGGNRRVTTSMALFHADNHRFAKGVKSIWTELASWGQNLNIVKLELFIGGDCIYELLGRRFRDEALVKEHLIYNAWLSPLQLTQLPVLPSVTSFSVTSSPIINLWPAIVGCELASRLPNVGRLVIQAHDSERKWYYARKELRNIIAQVLEKLPRSLRNVQLDLDCEPYLNHKARPPSFLCNGVDTLSRSINHLSTSLASLSVALAQTSPDLFWDPTVLFPKSSRAPLWPNLTEIYIYTSFEIAAGGYCMRSFDKRLGYHRWDWDEEQANEVENWSSTAWEGPSDEDDDLSETEKLAKKFGEDPPFFFRDRPVPEYFDTLAISIAQAAACMPRLRSITLDMSALEIYDTWGAGPYHGGWGFAFRSGNEARRPDTFSYQISHQHLRYPDINDCDLQCPRAEWLFHCPSWTLEWEEPGEAKTLWKQRFPCIDLDVVTLDIASDKWPFWRRKRNGVGAIAMDEKHNVIAPRCENTRCCVYNWD